MIDCLSNPSWINPQIDCLLFLQHLRVGHFEMFDKFFLSITIFGEFWLPTLICAITYWCIDSKAGIYLFSLESFNVFFTHLFKMIACVYRPWILNPELQPSSLAVPFAKGYSFPSGHSAMTSSVVGGVAYLLRKNKILCFFLICLILLVGFSRLWLGVHTLQDVICGLLLGLILIFAINSLVEWAEKKQNRYLYIAGIVDVLVILAMIYLKYFNIYRLDYVANELLVNPQTCIYSTFVIYACSLGLLNGFCLCRKFFPFNPKDFSKNKRIKIGVVGVIVLMILLKCIFKYLFFNIINVVLAVSAAFMLGIFITLIYPIIFIKWRHI